MVDRRHSACKRDDRVRIDGPVWGTRKVTPSISTSTGDGVTSGRPEAPQGAAGPSSSRETRPAWGRCGAWLTLSALAVAGSEIALWNSFVFGITVFGVACWGARLSDQHTNG
jgi:hypothetical protein